VSESDIDMESSNYLSTFYIVVIYSHLIAQTQWFVIASTFIRHSGKKIMVHDNISL